MRYTEIPITLTPKISFLYLLQIVTACDIKSNTVFLIKNAEKNVVLYCLVITITSEEIAFQTLLRLLQLISVFGIARGSKWLLSPLPRHRHTTPPPSSVLTIYSDAG